MSTLSIAARGFLDGQPAPLRAIATRGFILAEPSAWVRSPFTVDIAGRKAGKTALQGRFGAASIDGRFKGKAEL